MSRRVTMQYGSSGSMSRKSSEDWELIWENPNPASSFDAQTLSLNLARFGWVKVEAVLQGSGENYVGITMDAPVETEDSYQEQMLQMVNRMKTSIASGEIYEYSRCFHVTEIGVTFQACSRRRLNTADASANSTQNARVVPTRIWGKTTASSVGGDASFHDSGFGFRKLWENSDPDDAFAGQTVSLDLSEYDAVFIPCGGADTRYAYPIIMIDGKTNYIRFPTYSGSNVRIYTRTAVVTATGVQFGAAARFQQGTSGTTSDNGLVIPKAIYGIKFG